MKAESHYKLGIDLGGTSIKAVAVTPAGETLDRQNVPFETDSPMDFARRISELISAMEKNQSKPADAIGLSAPGLAARDARSIACMPGRLQGLEGLEWTTFLKRTKPVPVLNDAHAALLGEVWLGAAKGMSDVILLTLGTGVGGAALVEGKLLRGNIGRGGHFGHASLDPDGYPDITGMPGSLEEAIGNCSIERRSNGRFKTTHELVAAADSGDANALEIWLRSVRILGCAIASFVNILDCEAAIVGGGIARCGESLFGPLRRFVNEVEWQPGGQKVKIIPAELGEFAGAYGAASGAG